MTDTPDPTTDPTELSSLPDLISALVALAQAGMHDADDDLIPLLSIEEEDGNRSLVMLHMLGAGLDETIEMAMERARTNFSAARLALMVDTFTATRESGPDESPDYAVRFRSGDGTVSECLVIVTVTPYQSSITKVRYRRPDSGEIVWQPPETETVEGDGSTEIGSGIGMLRTGLLGGRVTGDVDRPAAVSGRALMLPLKAKLDDDGDVILSLAGDDLGVVLDGLLDEMSD